MRETRPISYKRRFLVGMLIAMFAAIIGWGVNEHLEKKKVEENMKAIHFRVKLLAWQRKLMIPSEALYANWEHRQDIIKLRAEYYEKYGVDYLVPYANLQICAGGTSFGGRSVFCPNPAMELSDRIVMYYNSSLEHFWVNNAMRGCSFLAHDLKNEKHARIRWSQYPEVMETKIMPLLVRITDAVDSWLRIEACHALLEKGDRSDALRNIVWLTACGPEGIGREDARKYIEEYHLDVKPVTDGGSTLEEHMANWQQIHTHAVTLMERYPITNTTLPQVNTEESYTMTGH